MFYADRLVYIFETGLALLSIPKLPICVDTEQLQAQAEKLALLEAGASMRREEMAHVPDTLLRLRANGEATLSEWGALTLQRHLLVSHLISMGYEISCQAF
jgi:hypothetical protein